MDFIKYRRLWFLISIALVIIAVLTLGLNWLLRGKVMNFGVDFTGGSIITVRLGQEIKTADIEQLRRVLAKYDLEGASIQKSGSQDLSVRSEVIENTRRNEILADLAQKYPQMELLEADIIGPVIGSELRRQAFWALVIATILITIYISLRFKFEYAVAATIALYHDTVIMVGLVALLWQNVDTAFVAAILTIMGYSINDTIIIFDRIRENLKRPGSSKKQFDVLVNQSILETLPRTLRTGSTTLMMLLCLLLFGGATIFDFAFVLFFGFAIGTCSSIFLASPLLVAWQKWQSR